MNDTSPSAGSRQDGGALPRLSTRAWLWVAAGLFAAIVAVGSYAVLAAQAQDVLYQDVGFTIESPQSATATFDVFFYDDGVAQCSVHALNTSYAEVGVATIEVSSANGEQQRITADVATTEEAVTATVQGCTFTADAG